MDNRRVSFKMNVCFTAVLLVVTFSLSLINFFTTKSLLFSEVERKLSSECMYLCSHIVNKNKKANKISNDIKSFIESNDVNELCTISYLEDEVVTLMSDASQFSVFDMCKDSVVELFKFRNIDKSDYFELPISELTCFNDDNDDIEWFDFTDENSGNTVRVSLSRLEDGKVVAVFFDVVSIVKHLIVSDFNNGVYSVIFNDDGDIIYHPLMNTHNRAKINEIPSIVSPMLSNDYYESNGQLIPKVKLVDNEKNVLYIKHNSDLGWNIYVSQPFSVVYGNLYVYMRKYVVVFLLILALSVCLIMQVSYTIVKPLRKYVVSLMKTNNFFFEGSETENELAVIKKCMDWKQKQLNLIMEEKEKNAIGFERIDRDMRMAKQLQLSMLTKDDFVRYHEFEIFATSESAYEVGGDLYDYFMLDEEHLLFAIGDVSGKGMPAALYMIFTQTLLRSQAKEMSLVCEIVEKLNDKLISNNVCDLFVTLFIGILNIKTGMLHYCNAGHCKPLLVDSQGQISELYDIHGIPIGIYADRVYGYSALEMNCGDMIVAYTDGVIDAKDKNGMRYGEDVLKFNLVGTCFMSPSETVKKVKRSVDEMKTPSVKQVDDITILALKYTNQESNL